MFWVNDGEVTFNVCKSMKKPSHIHDISIIDVVDEVVTSMSEVFCVVESLGSFLSNYYREEILDYEQGVAILSDLGSYSENLLKLNIDLNNQESPPSKTTIKERPKIQCKVTPPHIIYVFLGKTKPFPSLSLKSFLISMYAIYFICLKMFHEGHYTYIVGIPPTTPDLYL